MPSGEVGEPRSKDGFLRSGYLKRYDLYDNDGIPSKIPVLNAQSLKPGYAVVFDVIQASIYANGTAYFIPVAVIRDEVSEEDWDQEWNKADNESKKIKIEADNMIIDVPNEAVWKNKVNGRIKDLRERKSKLPKSPDTLLKQLVK